MKLPEIAVRRPITTIMIFSAIALLGVCHFSNSIWICCLI